MNKSKYSELAVMNKNKAFIAKCFPNFKGIKQLNEDKYIVEKNYCYYAADIVLEEGVFILDNAKLWYIKFPNDFINKCIDMRNVHFIQGDRQSVLYDIWGS
jgi:hypothetical protein